VSQLLQSPRMTSLPPATEDSTQTHVADQSWPARINLFLQKRASLLAAMLVIGGFVWRLWLAHATFLNTDEAWHFAVANQTSLPSAYHASLTLAHPPLLVFVLYFWRQFGTSDLMLRFPGVLAGSLFCWVLCKWLARIVGDATAWAGVIFACFLPPIIVLSAELRQYSLMLLFAISAAYFLERALAEKSAGAMLASSACLYLAMLSHYSAFLFAAALGVYAIVRMSAFHPGVTVSGTWAAGQAFGVAIAAFLYRTHISKLGSVYPAPQPLQRFGDFYLSDWYFHAGRDHLLPFLYRGTFGVFRFIFGQTGVGQIAALLFVTGILCLVFSQAKMQSGVSSRSLAILLVAPFLVNWVAVVSGLYPYGRTRQCVFLLVFALAGVGVAIARIFKYAVGPTAGFAVLLVVVCQAFGTLQGRDMLPLAEQRHAHMDHMLDFIRSNVGPNDVVFTDQATSFQLRHYLCNQKSVSIESVPAGFGNFRCEGFHVVFTGPNDGALTLQALDARWHNADGRLDLETGTINIWVVQGGWASGLGQDLRRLPSFSNIEVHSFGRYLEVFRLPNRLLHSPQG